MIHSCLSSAPFGAHSRLRPARRTRQTDHGIFWAFSTSSSLEKPGSPSLIPGSQIPGSQTPSAKILLAFVRYQSIAVRRHRACPRAQQLNLFLSSLLRLSASDSSLCFSSIRRALSGSLLWFPALVPGSGDTENGLAITHDSGLDVDGPKDRIHPAESCLFQASLTSPSWRDLRNTLWVRPEA